jgi:hypothetical protein
VLLVFFPKDFGLFLGKFHVLAGIPDPFVFLLRKPTPFGHALTIQKHNHVCLIDENRAAIFFFDFSD